MTFLKQRSKQMGKPAPRSDEMLRRCHVGTDHVGTDNASMNMEHELAQDSAE